MYTRSIILLFSFMRISGLLFALEFGPKFNPETLNALKW